MQATRMIQVSVADLDALSIKLMCARGIVSALMNTMDDKTGQTTMPPERMHEALFAAQQMISEASEISARH